jgi:hypothetical protein
MTENANSQEKTYEVGYAKPPLHSRFKKGQSGNPKGRPRSAKKTQRVKRLVLQELYRLIAVREGEKVIMMPALQAVIRSSIVLAVKGSGPAQRAVLNTARQMEKEDAVDSEQIRYVIGAEPPLSEEQWVAKHVTDD